MEDAPNIDLRSGGGRFVYDKARRTIVSQPKDTITFDQWFLKASSWGLTYDQLVTCSFTTPGNDPGDVVYTNPGGSALTRHMCSHWINFYGAAQMGWNARGALMAPNSYSLDVIPLEELEAAYVRRSQQ